MNTALLIIDFINEMSHSEGKLAKARGYFAFLQRHDTMARLNGEIARAVEESAPVIFISLGFDPSYSDQPTTSPVFGKAAEFDILRRGTWSTEINAEITVPEGALTIYKQRVSAFHGTFLEGLLHNLGITHVRIAGIATDLAVESAARDAHDRDFIVSVLGDCCGAVNEEEHENALHTMRKFASID